MPTTITEVSNPLDLMTGSFSALKVVGEGEIQTLRDVVGNGLAVSDMFMYMDKSGVKPFVMVTTVKPNDIKLVGKSLHRKLAEMHSDTQGVHFVQLASTPPRMLKGNRVRGSEASKQGYQRDFVRVSAHIVPGTKFSNIEFCVENYVKGNRVGQGEFYKDSHSLREKAGEKAFDLGIKAVDNAIAYVEANPLAFPVYKSGDAVRQDPIGYMVVGYFRVHDGKSLYSYFSFQPRGSASHGKIGSLSLRRISLSDSGRAVVNREGIVMGETEDCKSVADLLTVRFRNEATVKVAMDKASAALKVAAAK